MSRPTPPEDWVIARRRQVGAQIRSVREGLNLSQRDVGGRSGVDVPTYSRIESGLSSPKIDTLIRIAAAMGVSLEDLVRRPRSASSD
ncbi:helix-turn-helix transcriptional regulator [Streptomyces sp. NPDC048417]|uniref:helix-turn-helix domain-containing protein n=1 Tax=Streptomyces sp. NPDC048417 TaxID=3155387 RepID=UPI00341B27B8